MTYYTAELLVALQYLHQNDIIYRDLKPDNVMIDRDGHAKLIDFGFARELTKKMSFKTYTNCGTMGYTAPEVLLNQNSNSGYSFEADIWSFGIMLSELLTGSLPFAEKEDPVAICDAVLRGEVIVKRASLD